MQKTDAMAPRVSAHEPPNFASSRLSDPCILRSKPGAAPSLDRNSTDQQIIALFGSVDEATQSRFMDMLRRLSEEPSGADPANPDRTIDANIQPLIAERDLQEEISRLIAAGDVSALAAMYEGYTQTSDILFALSHQPWAGGADDFIMMEAERAIAKAYLIADRAQSMRPSAYEVQDLCRMLFDCALRMGNTVSEALTVAGLAQSRMP